MLKLKQSIIYITIFCFFTGSFPELAQSSALVPPPATDTNILDEAINQVSETDASFSISPEAVKSVNADLSGNQKGITKTIQKLKAPLKEQGLSTIQSLISSVVLLGAAEIRQRAHQRNLSLTPENIQKLTDELGQNWSVSRQAFFGAATTTVNGLTNKGLTALITMDPGIKAFLESKADTFVFKYLVSGALFSIGNNYINGLVSSAAELVLNYPDKFGGTSKEEQGALRLLQTRASFTYFTAELFMPKGVPFQTAQQTAILHNTHWKVLSAMSFLLSHDSKLLSALMTHLFSSAALQGKNVIVIATAYAAEKVSVAALSEEPTKWEEYYKGIGISILMGIVGSFIPNKMADWGTAYENYAMAATDRNASIGKIKWHLRSLKWHQENPDQALTNILNDELLSRESRIIKYAYLMQMSLGSVGTFMTEREHLIENHKAPGKDHPVNYQKALETAKEALYNHDSQSYAQLKQLKTPAEDFLSQLAGWDLGSYSSKLASNEKNIAFYQKIFNTAAYKMKSIYSEDIRLFQTIASQFPTPQEQDKIQLETRNLLQMEVFIAHFTDTLSQKWITDKPNLAFYPALQLLEETSFWGMSENNTLKTLNTLNYTRQGPKYAAQ